MFAMGATASKNSPTVKFNDTDNGTTDARFKHRMTRLVLNITTDTGAGFTADQVASGTYTLSGIKHNGTFNTQNGTAEATGDATDNWVITDYITYANNIGTCSLILYPQTGASLTFSATIDGQTYTGTLQYKIGRTVKVIKLKSTDSSEKKQQPSRVSCASTEICLNKKV